MAPMEPGPPWVRSKRAVASWLKVSRFSSGSPSTSQMTRNGIGKAKVGTRSTVSEILPAASISPSWRSMIASMPGRSRARRRIVNSGVSSRRSRVWSGGSVNPRPPMSPSVVEPLLPM